MEYKYLEEDTYKKYNSNEPLGFVKVKNIGDLTYCLANFKPEYIGVGSRQCKHTLNFLNSDADYLKYYYAYYSQETKGFTKVWKDRLIIRINPNNLTLWQEDGIKQITYAPLEDTIFILRRKNNVFINEKLIGDKNAALQHNHNGQLYVDCFNLSEEEEEKFRLSFANGPIYDQPLLVFTNTNPDYKSYVIYNGYYMDKDSTIDYYELINGFCQLVIQFKVNELPEKEFVAIPNAEKSGIYIEPNTLYPAYRKYFDKEMPFLKNKGNKLERNHVS